MKLNKNSPSKIEGVPVGGGSVCLIQNFGFADSSVTPYSRATSSTLEEEILLSKKCH